MKKPISLLLLLLVQFSFAQNKKIKIIDKTNNLPIENVNLSYQDTREGTFTNADGEALLNLKKNDLMVSMMGYENKKLSYDDVINTDTIYLNPNMIVLKEVAITPFNLKKAIKYVLDNYSKLYVDVPFEKECNFKETLLVNDDLKRLILTKVNWWDKTYKKKAIKLRLGTIEQNKEKSLGIFTDVPSMNNDSREGYINPRGVTNGFYLNSELEWLMDYIKETRSRVTATTENTIQVDFETDWVKIRRNSFQRLGTILFDKKSKAILNISFIRNFKNWTYKYTVKESNKERINETNSNIVNMNFYESLNGKLSLKSKELAVHASITYNGLVHNIMTEFNIYVLNETAKNSVSDEGLIDLKQPFCKNLPSKTITNTNSILLSKKEMEFINSK